MVMKKSEKDVEFESIRARTLSKEDSPKKDSICNGPKLEFTDVKTGHGKLDTGNKVKEIGPGEQARDCFRLPVYGFQS